jgi:hypothetical protein
MSLHCVLTRYHVLAGRGRLGLAVPRLLWSQHLWWVTMGHGDLLPLLPRMLPLYRSAPPGLPALFYCC